MPQNNVTVYTDYMGGGFGSKFGADVWGRTAAELEEAGGRPVRMFLDRTQEHLAAGNRPSCHRQGQARDQGRQARRDGRRDVGNRRQPGRLELPAALRLQRPRRSRAHAEVFVNGGGPAPCVPWAPPGLRSGSGDGRPGRQARDRPARVPDQEPRRGRFPGPRSTRPRPRWAELIGWKENRRPRGQNGKGPIKRGLGCGFHQWGGGGTQDKQVTCTISPDGSVELKSATQDIGTGARTVLAIIAAEILGLEPTDITSNIGNSTFVPGQPSGGSTTTPSMSPPCYMAVTQARDALFAKIAPALDAKPADLELKGGKLLVKGEAKMSWKDACRKLGMMPISEVGKFEPGLAQSGVGGVQFVDLTVDIETGVVRLKKIVAIQDSGLIIDRLTWESQVYGGVIGGLNYGLFEERIMDPVTGVMLNADMELYKLAGASDIPEIIVKAYEPDEQKARGVIGVGEPPTIATAAAIANAVTNAIGVRVPEWPMSPRNILNALASASK
ncbi:MAG: molybdopterin cofactor-binding domain-containing protein [Isosphaeraceae bacterium]